MRASKSLLMILDIKDWSIEKSLNKNKFILLGQPNWNYSKRSFSTTFSGLILFSKRDILEEMSGIRKDKYSIFYIYR